VLGVEKLKTEDQEKKWKTKEEPDMFRSQNPRGRKNLGCFSSH
jgi:hypothetical protein